jgi:cytochrome c oxidase subunit 4
MKHSRNAADLRQGVIIMVILAVLTVVEYLLATATGLWLLLVVIALVKAAIVIQYYMHLPRVLGQGGGH